MRYLISIICLAFLAGCDGVLVDKPFGDKPTAINVEDWNGYWYFDDEDIYKVLVVNAEEGILEIAMIGDSDENMTLEKFNIYLRESGDWKFMFIGGEDPADNYTWYKYENYSGKLLLIWDPSTKKFKGAIEEGLLPGVVKTKEIESPKGKFFGKTKSTTIRLKDIGNDEIEIIKSEDHGIFFNWQNPIIVFKVKI